MTKTTSFNLTDHFDRFITGQVESGEFGSASEVVRAGLRLLEERQVRMEALRKALIEGEESGPTGPLDMEEIKRKAREQAGLPATNA